MWKFKSRKAVVIARLVGVILLAVAVNIGWDAYKATLVKESDLFSIKGRVRFIEKEGERLFSNGQVLVWLEGYPASFFIDAKGDGISAADFSSRVKAADTARVVVRKEELALLYTSSPLRVYGLYRQDGAAVYGYEDASRRDAQERLWLYIQAGVCLLGGLILLFLPRNYLLKE